MKAAFDNSYARLPDRFFARVLPTPVGQPKLLAVNRALAELLGIDPEELASTVSVAEMAGNAVPDGAEPIALAYAGHQFGGFVPSLGDGRAILLGEVVGRDGVRRDIQLKGAGRTPFSRRGDGRAALGPVLREYVVSEAMAALGVPTTRALAAVSTGETIFREKALPGAVFVRVASSHLRVGTFQYFAARDDVEALERLTRYALERHFRTSANDPNPALALLDRVVTAQAELVARWLGLGFVHGVMNTDNSSISGETIDYGPCAFLDTFKPNRKFSSIDEHGRYAYDQQPGIALWNLARLAEALLPIVDADEEKAIELVKSKLDAFRDRFPAAHAAVFGRKLGILEPREEDVELLGDLFDRLEKGAVDFTLFFRGLASAETDDDAAFRVARLFSDPSLFGPWRASWQARLATEKTTPELRAATMRASNPAFIPRNHRIEAMIAAATAGDMAPFERLLAVLARPYDDQPEAADLAEPPGDEQWRYRTFCGT